MIENAPCAGKHAIFDSRLLCDHIEAKRICRTCPVILDCAALLRDVQDSTTGGPSGGPEGTWAGRLVGARAPKPRASCGTDSGYSYHRRRGEEACDACHEARRVAERRRYAARKEAS